MEATTGSVEDNLFDRLKSTSADGSAESSRESQNTDDGLEVSRVLSEEEENSGSKAESDDDIVDEPNNSMPSFNLSEKAQPEELTSPPPVKRPRRSVHFLPNLPEILEITFQDNRASKENNSRRSSRLETTENAAGRKKSSLKTAAASKKSVNFPEQPDIVHEIEVSMTERQPAILAPGKWRKSMALWKKSQDALRESDEIQSHRRISMFVSNKKDLKRMTQHLQESLSNSEYWNLKFRHSNRFTGAFRMHIKFNVRVTGKTLENIVNCGNIALVLVKVCS